MKKMLFLSGQIKVKNKRRKRFPKKDKQCGHVIFSLKSQIREDNKETKNNGRATKSTIFLQLCYSLYIEPVRPIIGMTV